MFAWIPTVSPKAADTGFGTSVGSSYVCAIRPVLTATGENPRRCTPQKSGRWDQKAKKWVKDAVNSPCIDAGDPKSEYKNEPKPNGSRINMGAYGNTPEASRSSEG